MYVCMYVCMYFAHIFATDCKEHRFNLQAMNSWFELRIILLLDWLLYQG